MNTTIHPPLNLSELLCGSLGRSEYADSDDTLVSTSPIDGSIVGRVSCTSPQAYDAIIKDAHEAFLEWRLVPAPERGEIVRQMGNALRDNKQFLGDLVTYEMGKITSEGLGEIQEAIDIADFAVGLSRQLYGKTMHSERRMHRMYEQWHPLGSVGVITAFNFPAAVWAWNSMIAAICGNATIWKASELTPITAVATVKICREVLASKGFEAIFSLITGAKDLGVRMSADRRLPLISATGSCAMGRTVAATVGSRLGRVILELGGNNAVTVLADADLDLVVRGTLFGAVGTAGQRCTTTRRLLVEHSIVESVADRLCKAYQQVRIGDPRTAGTLIGPLVSPAAVMAYKSAIERIPKEGGRILYGGKVCSGMPSENYVEPTLVLTKRGMPLLREETFAPILYIVPVAGVDEAIAINNEVDQGLSSALFTSNFRASERFLSHAGSDCGIANVNIGTSGAEIGGAFGGEKDTGGGREAGSDSWKQYMRRQTCTLNFGTEMPLAQGVVFS